MLEYCQNLLNIFLSPFHDSFVFSVLGTPFLFMLIICPVLYIRKIINNLL